MNLRHFDLNLLTILNHLFELRSVSNTAKRLNVSQPTISAALARLRDQFGDELFVRSAAGLIPTQYAASLERPVREVIKLIDSEVLSARSFDPLTTRREIAISTSDIGEAVLLPGFISYLESNAPLCSLSSISLTPNRLATALAQGDVDIAIGYFPDLTGNGIHLQVLDAVPLKCICRIGHPLADETLDIEQFSALPQAVVGHGSRSIEVYEKMIHDYGAIRNIKLRLANMMSLPAIISSSDIITIAPFNMAELYPGLTTIDLSFGLPSLDVCVFWHHRSHKDPMNIWLRKAIGDLYGVSRT